MTRRLIGIGLAIVLALVGTVVLVAYVSTAEDRALAGEELVEVYVVQDLIPGGTPVEEIEGRLAIERVPEKVRPSGAVTSLSALDGRVAMVDLLPGEQLVEGRFVARSEFADRAVGIDVPEDMLEVTIQLDPQRAIGGLLEPGQTVTVLASFEPFQLAPAEIIEVDENPVAVPTAVADASAGSTPNTTDTLLRKVLVTAVQRGAGRSGEVSEDDRLTTAPENAVFVTLAVRPFDAERLVFTAEFGDLWLAIERETVPEVDDPAQTRGSVLQGADTPEQASTG